VVQDISVNHKPGMEQLGKLVVFPLRKPKKTSFKNLLSCALMILQN